MTSHITTGMPRREHIALTGSISAFEIMSQASMTAAPVMAEAGRSTRWSLSSKIRRATWGIAMPMKPIGPQKAVTEPARRVVDMKISVRQQIGRAHV